MSAWLIVPVVVIVPPVKPPPVATEVTPEDVTYPADAWFPQIYAEFQLELLPWLSTYIAPPTWKLPPWSNQALAIEPLA